MLRFIAFLFLLPTLAFSQIMNAKIQNAKISNALPPNIVLSDFLIDFMASGTNLGTLVTLATATNATRSYIKGPWVYEASTAPNSNTNMYVWTNRARLPTMIWCDGSPYNLTQTTNCWELTNANYQFLTYQMPNPGPFFSWFFIIRVYESGSSLGFNLDGPESGGELVWSQWVDDPATGYWINETLAGGSSHIPAVGMTNMYLYFTGMVNTNLGQTLLFMYTNTAADMSGTWGFVGSCSNSLTLGPGTGNTLFDIGRMDVHGNVAATKFDFIMVGVDSIYHHFPMGPLPWTNAWAPIITLINPTPAITNSPITWSTDHSSDSLVNYGLTSAYGSGVYSSASVRNHSVNLTNLTASTTYHFQVCSKDGMGLTSCSADSTFSTLCCGCTQSTGIFVTGATVDTINWENFGNGDQWFAQKFIPTTNTVVCGVLAPWYKNNSSAAQIITARICTNSLTADQPGAFLDIDSPTINVANLSTTAPGTTPSNGGAWSTNLFSSISLTAGAIYWFVAVESPDNGSNFPIWTAAAPSPGNNSIMISTDGANTWSSYSQGESLKYFILKASQ